MNRWVHAFVCLPILAACASFTHAEDVLEELYGSGVHAYFAGNATAAEERFNEAISAGSQDPRVYYFRGLNQIRSQGGDASAGLADFESGARLEMLGRRGGDVSKALQRIQGPARMEIERIRTQARLTSKSKQFELMRQRYEAVIEGSALPEVGANKAVGPNPTDPFVGDGKLSKGTPEDMPAGDAAGATNPAADDVKPADPFADDVPADAPEAPAAGDDPFGAPAAEAGESPFGF